MIFVDYALIERVKKARLERPEYMTPVPEEWQITQAAKTFENMTDAEICAAVVIAVKKYPQMVLNVIFNELEGQDGQHKDHRNCERT